MASSLSFMSPIGEERMIGPHHPSRCPGCQGGGPVRQCFMCSDGYVLLPRMKAMHSDDEDEDDDSDDEWD